MKRRNKEGVGGGEGERGRGRGRRKVPASRSNFIKACSVTLEV